MADDLQNRGPADRSRINMNEAWELKYWTKELGCSEAQLRSVIKEVGSSAQAVRERLKRSA
jgi:hypothetical protein